MDVPIVVWPPGTNYYDPGMYGEWQTGGCYAFGGGASWDCAYMYPEYINEGAVAVCCTY